MAKGAKERLPDGSSQEQTTVFGMLERSLRKHPFHPAVVSTFQKPDCLDKLIYGTEDVSHRLKCGSHKSTRADDKVHQSCLTLTYTQLHRTALRLCSGLTTYGAHPNSTVVMLIPNGGECAILLWACILFRMTYVNLDPDLLQNSAGRSDLKSRLQALKPELIVVPDARACESLDTMLSELEWPGPDLRICLTESGLGHWKSLVDVAINEDRGTFNEESYTIAARNDSPERIHSVMFTSGTSGHSKGCPLTVRGMTYMLFSQSWLIDEESSPYALQQPHNSRGIAPAQMLQTWKAGGAVIMTGQNLCVRKALEAIKTYDVSFIVLTPPMVHEMANELLGNTVDVSSVKTVQVGGDTVTKGVLIKCASVFPRARVCVNHGMTEGGGSFFWPFKKTPVSEIPFFGEICPVGKVAPGTSIRIWDGEQNRIAGKEELGELHISSPSIIEQYIGSHSVESFYEDSTGRWFRTGDIALLSDDELVFILGRKTGMIKRKDVAIVPAVIENSIEAFTGAHVSRQLIAHSKASLTTTCRP
jgi:acyl-CoA synthetase (AMP-forming)/AMP-acid ligase II